MRVKCPLITGEHAVPLVLGDVGQRAQRDPSGQQRKGVDGAELADCPRTGVSLITTPAPCAAKSLLMCAPRLPAPPVTIATRPSSSPMARKLTVRLLGVNARRHGVDA